MADHLERLTRELADKGKPIEAGWTARNIDPETIAARLWAESEGP